MQNLDTILNHWFYNYSMIKIFFFNFESPSATLLANGKNRFVGLKNKSFRGSKTTALIFFFFFFLWQSRKEQIFLSIFFSYQNLMGFIRHMKGHRINFVFKITQYQALCMNSYRKWRKGVSLLRCLRDKWTLKGKCPFIGHVFSPNVKLELQERCSQRCSKLLYSINTAVKAVRFTWHQSHLSRTCWSRPLPGKNLPVSNGSLQPPTKDLRVYFKSQPT